MKNPLSFAAIVLLSIISTASAAPSATAVQNIEFEKETLDNGLRVIYAPMHNAPVVHVRVFYHVGSKDEKPDRQGFAHMFEHMMFRGSAHVLPEEHMKRIGEVGGNSNAFTSFDQTTYVNTIPSSYTEAALYLEADRMASFKVSDDIFKTERKVVSEEWRLRTANPPYGTMDQDFFKTAFKTHSYRWTTIGDMDQLRAASSSELQDFYNHYYLPNNACLIVAGEIDVPKTKEWVRKYFGWIPKGPDVKRGFEAEPQQTESRSFVLHKPGVPLTQVTMGFKTTDYTSDDHFALSALADILSGRGAFTGGGRGGRGPGGGGAAINSSRLNRLLINGDKPLCTSARASDEQLEDQAVFMFQAQLLPGTDAKQVEQIIGDAIKDVAENGVKPDELERAKTGSRIALIRGRETCTQIATELGEEEVFGHDANRVNQKLAKIDALKPQDIQNVAKKYLVTTRLTTIEYVPDPTGKLARADGRASKKADATENAPVVASNEPIKPRVAEFPANYPAHPPATELGKIPPFAKGEEFSVNGVRVIAISDHRLPLVNWSLILRGGSDSEPKGKEGVGQMTASMLRRGSGKTSYRQIAEDLENRGISIDTLDDRDNTRFNGSCTSDQLDYAITRAKEILREPAFPETEFAKVKILAFSSLRSAMAQPAGVASREISMALYGADTVLGRQQTPESVQSITLEDVKNYYAAIYQPADALLVISGDIDTDRAHKVAETLLADWKAGAKSPTVDYAMSSAPEKNLILIDNPDGKQSSIRISVRAYDVKNDKDKFAGILATQILSSGIDSRLGRYVRAEKGYTYGVRGIFTPGRHGGAFDLTVDTNPETTGPCIVACQKVLDEMASGKVPVTDQELAEAKMRAIGGMVMDTQSITQQATRRVDAILNGYPIDYYDKLPERLNDVKADEVRDVVAKYVKPDAMVIVVVGPGEQIKSQLDPIRSVEVKSMPAGRKARGGDDSK